MTGSEYSGPLQPDHRSSFARLLVLMSLCAAAAIAYLQRTCIGVAESTIRADLQMSKEQMGWALGGFFAAYALFQIPTGWLGQLFGPRKMLPFYSVVWSGATALTGLAGVAAIAVAVVQFFRPGLDSAAAAVVAAIWWLYAIRVVSGIGQAGLFPCAALVISNWYPQSQRASVSGWVGSFQQVGAIIAAGLTGWLLVFVSWRWMFVLFALPGLLWAWIFYVWFRNRPQNHAAVNPGELRLIGGETVDRSDSADGESDESYGDVTVAEGTPWLKLLFSPPMWFICGQQFCRGAGYIFYASWFPTFLQETRGVTVTRSGLLTMLVLIAGGIGSALAGIVSDRMLSATGSVGGARRSIAILGMLGCASLIFGSYFVENVNVVVLIISGGTFCAALAGPSGYATTIDMGGRNVATIFATMNMAGNAGAAIFPVVVPMLQKQPGGWNLVLVVFGGVYVGAALFWMLLNPTGTFAERSLLKG